MHADNRQVSQAESSTGPARHPQEALPEEAELAEHRRRSLVEELEAVLAHADGSSITIREAADVLRERGPAVVMVLMMLPFCFPLPLWGLSTPVGFAVAIYGFTVMLQRRPWMPRFLGNRRLSFHFLEKLVHTGVRWGRRLEHVLKPRLHFMLWPFINVLIGASLVFCGVFLSLPLPIPFSNAIPAIAIILLLLGTIERDGVAVIAGQVVSFAILCISVYAIYLLWRYGFEAGWQALASRFSR